MGKRTANLGSTCRCPSCGPLVAWHRSAAGTRSSGRVVVATADLGQVLTLPYAVPGGTAQLYERGIVLDHSGTEIVVEFRFPMIGRPHIATGGAPALDAGAIRFGREHLELSVLAPMVQAPIAGRGRLV